MTKSKLLRHLPVLAVLIAGLGVSSTALAGPPNYCDPLGGCRSLKVSPSTVRAGHVVVFHGSVGHGCQTPGRVTIISAALKGAARHSFAGVPAIYTTAGRKGSFSATVKIKRSIKHRRYHVSARCGGGNVGSTSLRVK